MKQADHSTSPAVRDALQQIARAARGLHAAGGYPGVIEAATQSLVPRLADLVVLVIRAEDGSHRVEVAHREPGCEPELRERVTSHLDALRSAAGRVSSRHPVMRSHWIPEVNPSATRSLVGDDPAIHDFIAAQGIRSVIVHPLSARGESRGALALARMGDSPPYTGADFAAGILLARRTALALDQAQMRAAVQRTEEGIRLDEAMEKWAHTFETASWGAAILDPIDWRIESANAAFARMHGIDSTDDLVGRLVSDFIAPESAEEVMRTLVSAPDAPHTLEAMHVRHDGTRFPVLQNLTVVRSSTGEVTYRAIHLQDLSDLKRAESRLQGAQRLEAVGRLAGGVAHEVNNMMTIVLGFSEFLLEAPDLGPDHRADVEEIRRAAARAAAISQQLLVFSRRQSPQATVLDMNAVVGDTVQLLRTLLPADIAVDTRLSAEAPWVRVDRTQLEQVLINLAFNARDAMSGGGRLEIRTTIEELESDDLQDRIGISIPAGTYAVLSVCDNGRGMNQETVNRVFEPFFTTKGVGQGTGLGLSTVYGIVKQSEGYVTVRSTEGAGTTFSIFFPRTLPADALDERSAVTARRGNETILVVEDEEAVRLLASRALRESGYRTVEANQGGEALRILADRGASIDLVLTDVVMPGMGGKELQERMAALQLRKPILFMSAYTGDEVREKGLLHGGEAYLQKPYTPAELTSQVRKILDEQVHERHSEASVVTG
ncbi:MAG TPA: ATP-binding protein [Gemmatimonadales bacterium]|nr:ATP-binding protein [Gemmatimonadales bacterium]